MKRLCLIRHGMTQYNLEKRYCGASDVPLTTDELHRLCPVPLLPQDTVIISSGMLRCDQSAEALFPCRHYRVNPCFREIDFGEFEGHTYDELILKPEYINWCSEDGMNAPPKGESTAEFAKRVDSGLNELLEDDGSFVLVTHGGVIAHIMQRLFPSENKSRYQWQPKHGEGYIINGDSFHIWSEGEIWRE